MSDVEASDNDRLAQLAQLAQRFGFELDYVDAHGERREVSAGTIKLLLHAVGIDASCDLAVQSAIELEDRNAWARAVPPVRVFREGLDELAIDIALAEGVAECRWSVELEGGANIAGQVPFSSLPIIDRKRVDGIEMQRRRLVIAEMLPLGYHVLRLEGVAETSRLIMCPAQCWLRQPAHDEPRLWGVAAQLYLLRSARNWGIGDFTDLRELMSGAAERDIDIVGVNPLHALFPDEPERASPYSPSSRVLLNPLYLDVEAVEGFDDVPAVRSLVAAPDFQKSLFVCQTSDLVRYEGVAALKWRVLRLLFAHAAQDRSSNSWKDFDRFCASQGEPLRLGCLFQALREHFAQLDSSLTPWSSWPEAFRDPASPSVEEFAQSHMDEIEFLQWLQWQSDRQLARASHAGSGMRVGLYRDLAVGTDPAGAECWSNQGLMLSRVHVGAPPDLFQEAGQDWGLAPFHPRKLEDEGYQPFVALLRANMQYAGALRIDHAMSLERLFWIPAGAAAREGAYVRYPLHDLLGIVALESERHECMVIGEDLGTVPPGFREQMREAGILSYRVLTFERTTEEDFLPADAYPTLALAVAGNHDLPTIRGWWEGRDIEGGDEKALTQRSDERRKLLDLIGLKERNVARVNVEDVISAVHAFLRKTPCVLAMAQLDDLDLQPEPVNVPGTSDENPNWRRRLSLT